MNAAKNLPPPDTGQLGAAMRRRYEQATESASGPASTPASQHVSMPESQHASVSALPHASTPEEPATEPAEEKWMNFSTYLPASVRRELRARCALLDVELRQATTDAVMTWLAEHPAPPSAQ